MVIKLFQLKDFIVKNCTRNMKNNVTCIIRRGYRSSLRGMRDFEKGKILHKKGKIKKGNFLLKLCFKIRPDFNVFNRFFLILN